MKDLRNHIKRAADQHTELVNNDYLWESIELKMAEPKKKRRIIPLWFWGLSLSMILLASFGVYHDINDGESFKSIKKSNNSINQNQSTKLSPVADKKLTNSVPSNASSRKIVGTKNQEVSKNVKQKMNQNKAKHAIKSKVNLSTSTFATRAPIYREKTESKFGTISKIINKDKDVISKEIQPKINLRNTTSSAAQSISMVDSRLISLTQIPSSSFGVIHEKSKLNISAEVTPIFPTNDIGAFSFFNSLTLYGQYSLGNKTIQGDGLNVTLRNESEELLEQIRIGIESDFVSFLDFTLYGGVAYTSINDRVSFEEQYYEDRELTYLDRIMIMPDGTEIETFTTEELPHLINNTALRYNSHKLISVPLGLRFRKEFSTIQLGLGFGVDLNYFLSGTQNILGADSGLTASHVEGAWSSPSFHSSLSINYPISEKLYLHSKVNFRSITLESISLGNSVRENYSAYGLDLGIKFIF